MLLSVLSLGGLEYLNLSKNWVYQCPKNILSGKIIVRKFRSQTSDNMGRWKKQRWEESERGRAEETRSEKRKSEQKEDRCAKRQQSCETLRVSNGLWLRMVEK